MNQRVHNLTKWRFVADGGSVRFHKAEPRTVVLEVNCPDETRFYVEQESEFVRLSEEFQADADAGRAVPELFDDPVFVGVVKGRDRLEFGVDGPFTLLVDGGGAYIYSVDGLVTSTNIVAPLIFTRIANRRQRNPHLELIEYQMRLNQQRMQDALLEEMDRRTGALKAELERYAPQRDQRAPAEKSDGKVGRAGVAQAKPEQPDTPEGEAESEGGSSSAAPGRRKKSSAVEDV